MEQYQTTSPFPPVTVQRGAAQASTASSNRIQSGALERLHAIGRNIQGKNVALAEFIDLLERGPAPTAEAPPTDIPQSLSGALDFIQDQLLAMDQLLSNIRSRF